TLFRSACIAALAFSAPLTAQTMPRKPASSSPSPSASASSAASPGKPSPRPIPFHGMVSAMDKNGKTFTIAGKEKSRVFKVTDKTTVTKGGNTATIEEIVQNEEVSGSYWKSADGSLEAKTVKIGPVKERKSEESKKARISSS